MPANAARRAASRSSTPTMSVVAEERARLPERDPVEGPRGPADPEHQGGPALPQELPGRPVVHGVQRRLDGSEAAVHVDPVVGIADRRVELGQVVTMGRDLRHDPPEPALDEGGVQRQRNLRGPRTIPARGCHRANHPPTASGVSTRRALRQLFDDTEQISAIPHVPYPDHPLRFGMVGRPIEGRAEPGSVPTEREVVDEMFMGEVVGTAVLILIGDGVVAGVLLNKSKAQNSGWIVITWAWAMGVLFGVLASLAVTERRRAPQPRRDHRSRLHRRGGVERCP